MKTLIAWLDRVSSPRLLLVLTVLEVALLAVENTGDFPLSVPFMRRVTGHPYLDMCAFCSASAVHTQLDDFGEVGRRLQLLLMPTIDVAIPLLSFAFGSVALSVFLRGRVAAWTQALRWLPVAALGLDFAENGAILALLAAYPRRLDALAAALGLMSGFKFMAYLAMLLAIAGSGFARRRVARL